MGPATISHAEVPATENVHVVRFIVNNIEPRTVPEFWDGFRGLVCDESIDPAVVDRFLTEWALSARLVTDNVWRLHADTDDLADETPVPPAEARRAAYERRARTMR